MCDLCTSIEPYTIESPLELEELVKPPRPLQKGERWDGRQILYSAAWIDEEGELHEFES